MLFRPPGILHVAQINHARVICLPFHETYPLNPFGIRTFISRCIAAAPSRLLLRRLTPFPQAFTLSAELAASPERLTAALRPRSIYKLHRSQLNTRSERVNVFLTCPHSEHVLLDAKNLSATTTLLPYHLHFRKSFEQSVENEVIQ